jgi:ferrous iron transport protein A
VTNLAKLKPGDTGKITSIGAIGPLKRRLMNMGVVIGEEVQVLKMASLGDPIEVKSRATTFRCGRKKLKGSAWR